MNLNDLDTFVVVAAEGTFTAAAQRLGVPISTVSRRVSRLEADLGVSLLNRGARSIALSDDGRALAEQCSPALREIGTVAENLGDHSDTPRGTLRLTAPIDIGATPFFTGLVAAYSVAHPGVHVDVEVTNRLVDLLEEGFDAAFRTHRGPLPSRDDLIVRRLLDIRLAVYSSPDYLRLRGPIQSWAELGGHPAICHKYAYRQYWPEPAILVDDYAPVAAMIAAGAGVGGLPELIAAPYVERGELVELDVHLDVAPASLSLVWLRSRHLAPRVRAFIDLAAARSGS